MKTSPRHFYLLLAAFGASLFLSGCYVEGRGHYDHDRDGRHEEHHHDDHDRR